jgi:transcriptional regulator with XRE-family HTH domain
MTVSQIVAQIIELTELNQQRFARKIGVAQSTVSKWISEGHTPNKSQWDAVLGFMAKEPRVAHLLEAARGPDAPDMDPDFLASWRKLTPHQRLKIVELVKGLSAEKAA